MTADRPTTEPLMPPQHCECGRELPCFDHSEAAQGAAPRATPASLYNMLTEGAAPLDEFAQLVADTSNDPHLVQRAQEILEETR